MKKKLGIFSIIFVIIDQVIKIIVKNNIVLNTDIKVIDNFFYLSHVHNDGAAFSMFSGNIIFLILITIIALVAIYMIFIKDKKLSNIYIVLISMLIGGILGNFIDRIIYNYVIDYLSFIIFGYYFPVFNFADICIVISIISIVILQFKEDICEKSKLKKS